MSSKPFDLQLAIKHEVWDVSDLALKTRFLEAIEAGVSRYPIFRDHRFAARRELQDVLDSFAMQPSCTVQRFDSRTLVMDSERALAVVRGSRKSSYCSCYVSVWADSVAEAERVYRTLLELVGDALVDEPMFSVDWHFLTSKGELESVTMEEFADDVLLDDAYPGLAAGVAAFIDGFLSSDETVLVLQGPPGTGKTRLIRAILGAISRRKGGKASALYTGDKMALENDEIFVRFVTGWEDAFVVEDADHLLRPRASGNENLHRFLTIADGIVRAQGRKIVFSTNLPNIRDIDDALVRPGRCFARLGLRELDDAQARRLVARLAGEATAVAERALSLLAEKPGDSHSLAEIYKTVAAAGQGPHRRG